MLSGAPCKLRNQMDLAHIDEMFSKSMGFFFTSAKEPVENILELARLLTNTPTEAPTSPQPHFTSLAASVV